MAKTKNGFSTGKGFIKETKALDGYNTDKGTVEARLTKEEAILNGYDTSKGTVEQRLTRLGFSEGVVSFPSEISGATVDVNFIRRQGKYVYGKVELSNMSVVVNHGKILFTIPEGFRISATAQSRINEVYGYATYKTLGSGMAIGLYFHTDGTAMVSTAYSSSYALTDMCVVFGYEID